MLADLIESIAKIVFVFSVNLGFFAPILGWVERKQSAVMQDRVGANRADIFGYTVIGLTGRPEQADYLKSLGAAGTLDDLVASLFGRAEAGRR